MKNIFAAISKVDDEQRMVYGIASTEALDVQGEVVTKEAMADALGDYMKFANIREMHQPSAVGVAKSAEIDADGRTHISVHVVDDSAWAKVKAGVYKGFSIGGKAVSKVEGVIKSLRLSEISLVDRPANPEALITVWKADGAQTPEQDVATLAEMLDKGEVTPARLIELAKADKAAAEQAAADAAAAPAADAVPPAADDAAKGDAAADVNKYEGEEVWDAATAMAALDSVMSLLRSERYEMEQSPEQLAALQAAVDALKEFIVLEIKEDNSPENVELADQGGDVAKAGKTISGKNMAKLQAMHDSLVALGVSCATEKHDHAEDMAKAVTEKDEAVAKVAALETDMAKIADDLQKANAEVERLKAMPAPGKALLNAMAFSKSDDAAADGESTARKISPVVDAKGDVNDAASLIKAIHSKGGVIVR